MTRDGTIKRRTLIGFAIVATALPTSMTAESRATTPPGGEPGWVRGVVVDADGKPIVGDLVNILGPAEVPEGGLHGRTDRRAFTDENGEFRVRQADPSGYLVQICEPAPEAPRACQETALGVDHMFTYVGPTGLTDSWVTQTSLFPTTEGDRNVGTITVKPQGYVHGHITGGGEFQPLQIQRLNGTAAYFNRTDDKGNYRFQGMAPGQYRIAAGGRDVGTLPWRSEIITVKANQDVEVNATLDPGADVHGVVRSDGKAVANLDILLVTPRHRFVAYDTTDGKGRYEITGVRPGSYRVGIFYDGSEYLRGGVSVTVPEDHSSVEKDVSVRKGAVVEVTYEIDGKPAERVADELRDSSGHPIRANYNDGSGHVTYWGLAPGDYTAVGAFQRHYTMAKVHVTKIRTYDLGAREIDRPTITFSGTTEPNAVVEVKTGQECPPDEPLMPGTFQWVERADSEGHFEMTGVVPGLYMIGLDGFPGNYAPYCIPDVLLDDDTTRNLPMERGSTASGRLVYAATGTPVIASLAYELSYPQGQLTNPTGEHPTRARTRGATGEFTIDRMAPGTVTGELASEYDEEAIGKRFIVIFPFQDGTPYYLTTKRQTLEIEPHSDLELGDIPVYLHK